MILDAYGRGYTKQTETRFDPRLVEMLMHLDDLLRQNGLGLFCIKCHRLGNADGVTCDNRPESDVFRMSCGCSVRKFHKRSGKEQVVLQ